MGPTTTRGARSPRTSRTSTSSSTRRSSKACSERRRRRCWRSIRSTRSGARTRRRTRSARSGLTAAFIAGIGGCATLKLDREFARWTPSYAYQFDDRHAPGLNDHHPGYLWGAGHAMELAYLWPSFDNGTPLAAQFTPAQRAAVTRDGPLLGHVCAPRRTCRDVAGLPARRADPVAATGRCDTPDRRRRVCGRAQVRVLGRAVRGGHCGQENRCCAERAGGLRCRAGGAAAAAEPWRDPGQPPLVRADELLAALSFDQKVDIAMGQFDSVASLGVPALTSSDGPSGVRADGTTSWPSAQTLAATFDRRLAHAYGEAIAAELRGKGFNTWLGPAMDIARTPLAGRQPENLGEDPFLAGHTVAAELQRREVRPRDGDAQALRRQQPGVAAHRVRHPPERRPRPRRSTRSSPSARCRRSMRRRSAPRSSAAAPTASCAPTTASTARRPARATKLLDTAQARLGLQRVRRPRLRVRRPRRPGRRQRRRRLPRAPGRLHRRTAHAGDVHVGPDHGRPPRRHGAPDPVRDVRQRRLSTIPCRRRPPRS